MTYAFLSERGSREINEDSFLVEIVENRGLFVVADGLGGHGKGEVASAIVVMSMKKSFHASSYTAAEFLPYAITTAQDALMEQQLAQNVKNEMKTTCAALLIDEDICRFAHVGDSRVYLFYKGKLKNRTYDHSVPQMLVISGEIKEKHIRNHPDRNKLLRVMGIPWESPQYEISEGIPLSSCEAFLLCSDGFWELCDERFICNSLKKSRDVQSWLRLMTSEVEKNGKDTDMDNYTAIAVIL